MNIRKHAGRILAGAVKGSAGVPIFPGYISFETEDRPRWWKDELAADTWGTVLGVHEAEAGSPVGAIVVTDRGLGAFNQPDSPIWVPYETISGYEKLSKEPVSRSLVMRTNRARKLSCSFGLTVERLPLCSSFLMPCGNGPAPDKSTTRPQESELARLIARLSLRGNRSRFASQPFYERHDDRAGDSPVRPGDPARACKESLWQLSALSPIDGTES